jgi:hypothetical protein
MRQYRISAISSSLPNPLVERVQALVREINYVSRLLKQLPLQPMLAALVMAYVLGVLPMMLTVLCSVLRTVIDWYLRAVNLDRAEPTTANPANTLIDHLEVL